MEVVVFVRLVVSKDFRGGPGEGGLVVGGGFCGVVGGLCSAVVELVVGTCPGRTLFVGPARGAFLSLLWLVRTLDAFPLGSCTRPEKHFVRISGDVFSCHGGGGGRRGA